MKKGGGGGGGGERAVAKGGGEEGVGEGVAVERERGGEDNTFITLAVPSRSLKKHRAHRRPPRRPSPFKNYSCISKN